MRAIASLPSRSRRALVLALAFASFSSGSLAVGTADQRAACTPDVFRLCSAQIPNVDAIVACLKREKAQLSSGCRAVFDAPPERAATTRSVATPVNEWCAFEANPDAGDQIWRNWCGEAAR
jgi:hypothetical protein